MNLKGQEVLLTPSIGKGSVFADFFKQKQRHQTGTEHGIIVNKQENNRSIQNVTRFLVFLPIFGSVMPVIKITIW